MRICFLAILLAMIAGCGQTPEVPEQRADKLAKSLCQCTEDLLSLNKKAENTLDSLAFQRIAQAYDKARTCTNSLGIKKEEKPELETALKSYCPELIKYPELLEELINQ